jgi:hypothetical protein
LRAFPASFLNKGRVQKNIIELTLELSMSNVNAQMFMISTSNLSRPWGRAARIPTRKQNAKHVTAKKQDFASLICFKKSRLHCLYDTDRSAELFKSSAFPGHLRFLIVRKILV